MLRAAPETLLVSCQILTMCDLGFLPQVLVLHRSLAGHGTGPNLRVLALDRESRRELEHQALPGLSVVGVEELEANDPEVAALRSRRRWREYCWTLTPAFCASALDALQPGAKLVWLDADIAFYTHPRALVQELGEDSVLLVPHRYDRPYPSSALPQQLAEQYGYYNGGTLVLRNDAVGRAAAARWRERTIEWCHSRVEPGRYGNQRYLEELVGQPSVQVSASQAIGVAPWNTSHRSIGGTPDAPTVDGRPIVFFHFQSLRLRRRWRALPRAAHPANYLMAEPPSERVVGRTSAWFRLRPAQRRVLWEPYLTALIAAADSLGPARAAYWESVPSVATAELRQDVAVRRALALGTVANVWRSRSSSAKRRVERLMATASQRWP
jgi:hypothetical protein